MKDPLHHDAAAHARLERDPRVTPVLTRLQWLKLAAGLLALAMLGAVWAVWRWG